MPRSLINWISVEKLLPPVDHIVLIHRVGGKNKHNDVGLGYRCHTYGTLNDWHWVSTGDSQDYWGISADSSQVIQWSEKPVPPAVEITGLGDSNGR